MEGGCTLPAENEDVGGLLISGYPHKTRLDQKAIMIFIHDFKIDRDDTRINPPQDNMWT